MTAAVPKIVDGSSTFGLLVEKSRSKEATGKTRLKDNIKMDFGKIGFDDVDRIDVSE
jgi:hypothetical protein